MTERSFSDFGLTALVILLWMTMLSAFLWESYAYRYAGVTLVLIAAYRYYGGARNPMLSWTSWLCILWGGYVLTRFTVTFLLLPGHPVGERELLFAFPLMFPALAFMLQQSWGLLRGIIASYFGIALIVLLFTTRFQAIFAGETVSPLIQHNQIHGAVCCGLLLIGAIFWALHYNFEIKQRSFLRLYSRLVSPAVVVLCAIAIYGAKSKGVWLAMGMLVPVLTCVCVAYLRPRGALIAIVCLMCLLLSAIYLVQGNIYRTAGATFTATVSMFRQFQSGGQIESAVADTIGDNATPVSMDERLQLWSNAWELVSSAPVFGLANEWSVQWPSAHYHVNYTIMHNGYLEILVRHGFFGLAIYALIFYLLGRSVYRASRRQLIPRAATHAYFLMIFFFSITLLSNSNNRLAMGESFLLLSSAFALVCEFRCRTHAGRALQFDANKF